MINLKKNINKKVILSYKVLTIALISDKLTQDSLKYESCVKVKNVTPLNYKIVLKFAKPDILFVESAWQGYKNRWKYKIASYPDHPKRNNKKLQQVVEYAKNLSIPTIFWNKEDGIHFDRFIDSAKLFDYIFTVDENCIQKYKSMVDKKVVVNSLMFAIQSKFHNFSGFEYKTTKANFVGSYSTHIHDKRRYWQNIMFEVSSRICGLVIFDRNSDRKSLNYRYPPFENMRIFPTVSYKETANIYKDYLISLNVNTIEDSPTMFSRRLIEIIACGRVAITNNTPSVEKYFKEYCYVFETKEELEELLKNFQKNGLSNNDKQKLETGANYVLKYHTWTHRLQEIKSIIGLKC
ncbi:MAG: glycosyltransferase [Campylobacteraceae bacterium]